MSEGPSPDAAPPAQLQISTEQRNGDTVLMLTGELDIASAPEFERIISDLLATGTNGRMIVDLRELTFIDSTGLRALLLARQHTADAERGLMLRPGPRQVQRVFELSGTIDRFEFEA